MNTALLVGRLTLASRFRFSTAYCHWQLGPPTVTSAGCAR